MQKFKKIMVILNIDYTTEILCAFFLDLREFDFLCVRHTLNVFLDFFKVRSRNLRLNCQSFYRLFQ